MATRIAAPDFSEFGRQLHRRMNKRSAIGMGVTAVALLGGLAVWAAQRAATMKKTLAVKMRDDQSLDDRLEQSMDASDAVAKY